MADRAEVSQDERDDLLSRNVHYVHKRGTCDEAGRPLSTYTCEYHQGFEDGIDAACVYVERLAKGIADARAWLDSTVGEVNDFSALCRILDRAEGRDVC